jgi:tetratricopeptide (TPR) repeat protein
MGRIEKTVFISYRRTNAFCALAISQNLTQFGYDVFFDFNGIASGDFEQVIFENIRARAHFLVLLTPSALERCAEPGDLLRREIEMALDTKRNIVPLMLEGFDFATPGIGRQLTGTLAVLKSYNALRIPVEYFDVAMERLRGKWLSVALDGVLHPASNSTRIIVKGQQSAAASAPLVSEQELTAEEWFERAFYASDPEERIGLYDQAISLKADYAEAFNNRGLARKDKGDLHGALRDFSEAIRLSPDGAGFFSNRGAIHKDKGDLDNALRDLSVSDHQKTYFSEHRAGRAERACGA